MLDADEADVMTSKQPANGYRGWVDLMDLENQQKQKLFCL